MPLHHPVEQVADGRLVGHVGGDELAVHLLRGPGAGVGVDVHAHHPRALGGEAAYGGQPDAAARAGHHCHPVGKPSLHCDHSSVPMNTFLTSVKACSASGPSSRPRPERFIPPNGVQ